MADSTRNTAGVQASVSWVLVDERASTPGAWDAMDALGEAGGAFDAVALPLGMDLDAAVASAVRMHRSFGVAVIPLIRQDALTDRFQPLLQCVAKLLDEGVLRRGETIAPTVLIESAPKVHQGFAQVSPFARALRATGAFSVAWLERLVMPAEAPPGIDFSVHCPRAGLDDFRPGSNPPPYEALDLIAGGVLYGGDDAKLAASATVLTGRQDIWEGDGFRLAGIGAPAQQLWLENAGRFARNRLLAGQRLAFLHLLGTRDEPLPPWLREFLRGKLLPSSLLPPAAESLVRPDTDPSARPRVALILHLYYPELWPEFLDVIRAVPVPADVYVSTPMVIAPAVRARVRRDCPGATVFGVRNLGRDVLPFLHVLRSVGGDAYDFVLKLHGKRSVHMTDRDGSAVLGGGDAWRRNAIDELAGSKERISAILRDLEARPEVGMIAPAKQLFSQEQWRCGTATLVRHLCASLGVEPRATHFPAGTMFWLRPRAIARLLSCDQRLLDFERECGQVDCTLHHAIERFVAHAAVDGGYKVIDTSDLPKA
ncbi:hypothetical protein BURK2_01934 [Burkholderiales bacterium]|nr:hypothetical protein BURK2_01934 [Burkholderiales bacterium]